MDQLFGLQHRSRTDPVITSKAINSNDTNSVFICYLLLIIFLPFWI